MITDAGSGCVPEHIHMFSDEKTGLECAIALHSTVLGPAAGGCRLWSYDDREAMVSDACRLAEGMSYKNALAGLPLGGGKAVIRTPRRPFDRAELFDAFGRAVASLHGAYITAEDVGTSVADMTTVSRTTRYVSGLPARHGQAGGDPSPCTARGVFLSMRHAVERHLGRDIGECTVAIQGVGHVGAALARLLNAAGARLVIADIDSTRATRVAVEVSAKLAGIDSIVAEKADVFAPCALGGSINERTVSRLAAKVVCGAANNQLGTADDAVRLADRNVLYAPDFVVNAGGIINVAAEYLRWSPEETARRIDLVPSRLAEVLAGADAQGVSPHAAAVTLACQLIAAGSSASQAAA